MTEDFDVKQMNKQIIAQFRESGGVGKVGPVDFENLVLLTTTGRRSGRARTTPLGHTEDDDGNLLLFASNMGSPKEPDWCANIRHDPHVTVETSGRMWHTEAELLAGAERDAAYDRWIRMAPHTADHQEKAGRTIPMVCIHAFAATD